MSPRRIECSEIGVRPYSQLQIRSSPTRRSALVTVHARALLALLLFAPGLGAQALCPMGRVAEVVIENQSIFDASALETEGRIRWAYRLANAVHIRTRQDFIASKLLLTEGDCFDPRRAAESARLLREFRFIGGAEVSSELLAGGDRRLLVRTRDEWTTKARLNVSVDEGIELGGASLFEENLLGRGITLGFFWANREANNGIGGVLEVPGLAGREVDALLGLSQNRGGVSANATFVRPLLGEIEGIAARVRFQHSGELFSYVLPPGNEFTHLTVPDRVQGYELTGARRFGNPGELYLLGGGFSYERIQGGAEAMEGIRAGDFSEGEPIASAGEPIAGVLSTEVTEQLTSRRTFRLNLLLGVRLLEFQTRGGLDALNGVQDFPTGWEVNLALGRSVGGGGGEIPNDLFTRAAALAGWARGRTVGQFTVTAEGRREDRVSLDSGSDWRDLLVEGRGILYLLPESSHLQNLVFRISTHSGWLTTSPFQLTLGGKEGLRGYSDRAFPGGRRAVASAEARVRSPSPFPNFLDLGFTLFGDVGAVWAGDAPFGVDSGWRGSVGAGLRVGFPAGSSSVIRFDLAFPTGPGSSHRNPILRISAQEWIGLLGDTRSLQMNRSRRSGIRGEFVGAAREEGVQ